MKGINSVFLLGRLGADPELRHTKSGTAVCDLSLATNRAIRRGEDAWEEEVTWHKITVWGDRAERLVGRVGKGAPLAVQGRLSCERWTDQQGKPRTTVKVVAQRVEILPWSGGRSSAGSGVAQELPPARPELDEIPF